MTNPPLRPGDRAFIVRRSIGPLHGCMNRCIGHPVVVSHVVAITFTDGPLWELTEGPSCPLREAGCPGVRSAPWRCLEPFRDLPADDDTDIHHQDPVAAPVEGS